jgi:hypothetical protein
MNDSAGARTGRIFALAGLCSALITLTLGAFWLAIFVGGAGLIFSVALLSTESILRRHSHSDRITFPRKLLAAAIVTVSYPCGVLVFAAMVSGLDNLPIEIRNSVAVTAAAVVSAFSFYWALNLITKTKRAALLWLLLIAVSSALLAGSSLVWGRTFTVLRPHWFISPFWVSLLIIGETGFGWVWGSSSGGSLASLK